MLSASLASTQLTFVLFMFTFGFCSTQNSSSVQPDRIMGGKVTTPREFLFGVSIQDLSTFNKQTRHSPICCGSLLTTKDVLTACHCLVYRYKGMTYKIDVDVLGLVAGTQDLRQYRSAQKRFVASTKLHRKCKILFGGWIYDFGIATASEPFVLTPGVVDVLHLPHLNQSILDTWRNQRIKCWAFGWRVAESKNQAPMPLLNVDFTLVPSNDCLEILGALSDPKEGGTYDAESHICTLGDSTDVTCSEASGSILLCGERYCGPLVWRGLLSRGDPGGLVEVRPRRKLDEEIYETGNCEGRGTRRVVRSASPDFQFDHRNNRCFTRKKNYYSTVNCVLRLYDN